LGSICDRLDARNHHEKRKGEHRKPQKRVSGAPAFSDVLSNTEIVGRRTKKEKKGMLGMATTFIDARNFAAAASAIAGVVFSLIPCVARLGG